jgi:Flp pilus assembly protein TadG
MKLHTHNRRGGVRRRGTVIVVFAVSLVALLSIVALSLDGGILMDKRREAQSTSDAAALAAANDLYANWWITSTAYGAQYKGLDPNGTAKAAALATAAANGYVNGVNGCTVTVNIPPKSGPFTGMACHTEVIISHSQPQYFSRIFGSTSVPYGSRSVSRGRRGGINDAIICLDPTGKGALSVGGNGSINVTGAPVQVNSNNSEAMTTNGSGATATAPQFLVAGSPGSTGVGFTGTIVPNSPPIPDPLANLPVPSTVGMSTYGNVHNTGNATKTLSPGRYIGGISATGGTLILSPGIYYMDGGGFNISGQANLTAAGVLIYNAPLSNSDKINITGQGTIVMSPMMTGPYQGILLFQDRTSTAPVSVSGSSGTTMTISGTFYAASATLSVQGNGSQQTIGSQYISYDLVLGGNGTYNCSWTPDITPGTREILLVE